MTRDQSALSDYADRIELYGGSADLVRRLRRETDSGDYPPDGPLPSGPRQPRRPDPQHHIKRRRFTGAAVAAGGATALATVWVLTGLGGQNATTVVSNLAQLGAAALAAVAAGVACLRAHSRQLRGSWALLAGAMASWALGQSYWTWTEWSTGDAPSVPSLADVGYLAAVPLVVASVLLYPSGRGAAGQLRTLLDSLIVATTAFGVVWIFLLDDLVQRSGTSLLNQIVTLAYPFGDLVCAAVALAGIARGRGRATGERYLVTAGILVLAVADFAFLVTTQAHTFDSDRLLNIGWMAGFLLIALSACYPTRHHPVTHRAMPPALRHAIPALAVAVGVPPAVLAQLSAERVSDVVFLTGVTLLLLFAAREVIWVMEEKRLAEGLARETAQITAKTEEIRAKAELIGTDIDTVLNGRPLPEHIPARSHPGAEPGRLRPVTAAQQDAQRDALRTVAARASDVESLADNLALAVRKSLVAFGPGSAEPVAARSPR